MDIKEIFDDIYISNSDKEVLKKRILSLLTTLIEHEKREVALFVLDFFNEYPLIESKSDLRYFLDEFEEKLDVDLAEIEKEL